MRVLLVRGDHTGCAFYRIELPAAIAMHNGVDCTVLDGVPGKKEAGHVVVDAEATADQFDVVVIQRPLKRIMVESIPRLQNAGVKVIVEVDDDFTSLHEHNQAWWTTHPANPDTPYNRDHVKEACLLADHVTCTTERLKRVYAPHGHCTIIRNYVPEFLTDWRYTKVQGMIGWTGAIGTHPGDLETTRGAVEEALQMCGGFFAVVGQSKGVKKALRLSQNTLPETGWLPVQQYYEKIGSLELGIVPLESSLFNQAKSNLKGLEFAAAGVPFIASPLAEYQALADEGICWLARRKDEWRNGITALMTMPELREQLAENARAIVREKYTLEKNWTQWAQVWEKVANA